MTDFIEEKIRMTEVLAKHELVVVGGGTGGVVAAIAAARMGVDTLIVEQFGYLGGSQTGALVTPLMSISPKHSSSIGGINEEIRQRMLASGDSAEQPGIADGWFNPEALKYVLEELCLESNVKILYHTFFSDVVMEGNTITGIIVQSKSGRQAIHAKRVVDASADADVSIRAGVPCESGRKKDGMNQAMSLRFNMGGIDFEKFCKFLDMVEPNQPHFWPFVETAYTPGKDWPLTPFFKKGLEDGVILEEDVLYFQNFSMPGRPGEMSFNCPRITQRVKGHSVEDLTNAQIIGKQKIKRIAKFCRKYFPGFQNSYIALTAPMVGVRESRRIVGDYVFTGEDVARAAKFQDAIASGNYPMDIHQPKKSKESVEFGNIKPEEFYEIPYRVLVPKNIENLLVVGRCISASFEGQSAIRVQGIIRTMGETVGYAMAVSLQDNVPPRQISVEKVRRILKEKGVRI